MRSIGENEMQKDKAAKPSQEEKPLRDDPEQSKRFEDAARELGAEKNAEKFERALSDLLSPPAKGK